ncbi:Myblike DNAbinding domain-containing protein [Mortierella sp. 14UC]|nr:Myblike DNAbinding domain-containing protein [Mortierella sp. 14UC]
MSTHEGAMSSKGKERQDSNSIDNNNNNNSSAQDTQHLSNDLDSLSDGIDVDVDDLLSDESDNDDLIDNEDDLALLLRTHGVTLDSSPSLVPVPSQGTAAATEGSIGGLTLSAFRAGGAGGAGGADPSNTRSAQTMSAGRSSYLHTHYGARIISDTETESDYGMESTQEHLSHDGENATLVDSTTNAISGTTPTDDTTTEPAPAPFVMDPEDNRRLTAVIRSQTANALEVNRKYQRALEQKLRDIEHAHNRNKKLRDDLQVWLERREIAERAPVVLATTSDRLGPPYFVDADGKTPPKNMDTMRKNNLPLIMGQKVRYWSSIERENLKRGVIAENKRLMFEKFLREGNTRAIDSLNNAPDVEMMLNTKGLDWKRISQRYVDNRSPSECLIQWTSHDHPGINRGDWSKSELMKLDSLVKKYNGRNWIQIALDLDTNRTGAQCFQKYQSKMISVASRDNWTVEEDNLLREAVRVLGEKNWQQVAYCLESRNSVQCLVRWTKSVNPAIRRGRWLTEEDGALRAAYEIYGGGRWAKIQQHVLGRTDIQCRERYMNVLRPSLTTGPWTKEEVERLDQLVEEHGEKWSYIATQMNGRTDNQCARRWKMNNLEEKEKRRGRDRRYLASRRRSGRMTLSALPTPEQDKEAIRETMRLKKKWDKRILKREMKILKAKSHFDARQDKKAQPAFKTFVNKERFVYNCWNEQWGDHVDPIEKVFNLGIPPPISDDPGQKMPANGDSASSFWNATLPDPASVARPGKVRPVPPCNATLTAFSNLIQQGDHLGGRFQMPHSISAGKAPVQPGEILTAQEQQSQEYRELEERFESVFMWPMLAGMLHMETARELVLREQAESAATPKRRRGPGKKPKGSSKRKRRAVEDGDVSQGQEEASSSTYGTPAGSWQGRSETEDVESSEYETDNDEQFERGGGSLKKVRSGA